MSQVKIRCRGVIMHEGRLLTVRHTHGSEKGADFYALPGGHLDFGEDPQECMKRELLEELGVSPEIGRLLFVHTFTNGEGKQSVEFFFEILNGAAYVAHEAAEKSHAHEIAEIVWMHPSDTHPLLPEVFADIFRTEKGVFSDTAKFLKG